jgi:shikimate kinase
VDASISKLGEQSLPDHAPETNNIILIGMFGSGKSTVGRIIADKLRYTLVDTDQLIERKYKKPLQRVLDELGMKGFMAMEDKTLQDIQTRRCVVAPGGSSVYYPKGMANLRKLGPVVFLKVDLAEIKDRIPDISNRGTVRRGGDSIPALYRERAPLYRKYADIIVDANSQNWQKTAAEVIKALDMWREKKTKAGAKPKKVVKSVPVAKKLK